MKRVFCDVCDKEIVSGKNDRRPVGVKLKNPRGQTGAEAVITTTGLSGDVDLCRHCQIDAFTATDDRPIKERPEPVVAGAAVG